MKLQTKLPQRIMESKNPITKIDWLATLKSFSIDEEQNYPITNIREVNRMRVVCVRLKEKGQVFTTTTENDCLTVKRVS